MPALALAHMLADVLLPSECPAERARNPARRGNWLRRWCGEQIGNSWFRTAQIGHARSKYGMTEGGIACSRQGKSRHDGGAEPADEKWCRARGGRGASSSSGASGRNRGEAGRHRQAPPASVAIARRNFNGSIGAGGRAQEVSSAPRSTS